MTVPTLTVNYHRHCYRDASVTVFACVLFLDNSMTTVRLAPNGFAADMFPRLDTRR